MGVFLLYYRTTVHGGVRGHSRVHPEHLVKHIRHQIKDFKFDVIIGFSEKLKFIL